MSNTIPPITDPLGKYWKQPAIEAIRLFTGHAIMTEPDLAKLPEYNDTNPSGVYPGKMWKRKFGVGYMLAWYGEQFEVNGHTYCSNNYRHILVRPQEWLA